MTARAQRPDATGLVLLTALVIATSGLVYELLAGTVASWVLGDSVTQFSTVIGAYLSALGLGSYASGWLERDLARRFVQVEIAVALVGGLTTPALFLAFAHAGLFRAALYTGVLGTGALVGLEIPLLVRVLQDDESFGTLVARVLTYDHLGSLVGSLLYSLVLVPRVGPLRTGIFFAVLNVAAALWSTWLLREKLGGRTGGLRAAALLALAVLTAVLACAGRIENLVEPGAVG